MAITKYSEGSIQKIVDPKNDMEKEYIEHKLDEAKKDNEDIEKQASEKEDIPPWVKE